MSYTVDYNRCVHNHVTFNFLVSIQKDSIILRFKFNISELCNPQSLIYYTAAHIGTPRLTTCHDQARNWGFTSHLLRLTCYLIYIECVDRRNASYVKIPS